MAARRQRGRKKYHTIGTLLFLRTRQSSKMHSIHRNGAHGLNSCGSVVLSIAGHSALGALVSVAGGPEYASPIEVLMRKIHFEGGVLVEIFFITSPRWTSARREPAAAGSSRRKRTGSRSITPLSACGRYRSLHRTLSAASRQRIGKGIGASRKRAAARTCYVAERGAEICDADGQ